MSHFVPYTLKLSSPILKSCSFAQISDPKACGCHMCWAEPNLCTNHFCSASLCIRRGCCILNGSSQGHSRESEKSNELYANVPFTSAVPRVRPFLYAFCNRGIADLVLMCSCGSQAQSQMLVMTMPGATDVKTRASDLDLIPQS